MHADKTLLLVGANDEMVRKAKKLGLHLLVLQHPEKVASAPCEEADLVRIVDYTDLAAAERAARELHSAPGFSVALSLTEPGLEPAGLINDVLGLGGTSQRVARRTLDKWVMRRSIEVPGLAPVATAPLRERTDIDRFAARHGYPLIIKPRNGTGCYGVVKLDGPRAADAAWERAVEQSGHRMARTSMPHALGGFQIEEYADGTQFSLECFSFAGRHVTVAIAEKIMSENGIIPLGQAMPARLDAGTEAILREAACRLLDAIGLRDGPSHTELRLTERGPAIIETHNRIAGGGLRAMVEGAYGIDLIEYTLGWPFRLVPELPDIPRARAGTASLILTGEPGRLEPVTGVEEALSEPDVLAFQLFANPGDQVRALENAWDGLGFVTVSGSDAADAYRRAAAVVSDTIGVHVRGEDGSLRRASFPQAALDPVAPGPFPVPPAAERAS